MIKINKTSLKTYKFGDIASNISERAEPKETKLDIYVGLEHLDPDCIHIKRRGHPSDVKGTKLRVYPGDIIFGKRRAYQRKAGIVDFDGICSAHAMVVRANPKVILPELLPFFMHSDAFMHRAVDVSEGSLSPTIKWKILADQEFTIPSLGDQKRIADLLWSIDASICAWKICTEKIDSLYKTLERKFLSDMSSLSGGKNFVKLEDICNISGGSTPLKTKKEFWGGDICWLTPTEVTGRVSIYIDDTKDKITDLGLKAISNKIYNPGTLMMTSRASIGDFVINQVPMATNQGFTNFECSERIMNRFLLYSLRFNVPYIKRLASGSTFLEVSKRNIKSLCIDLPELSTQIEIVEQLESVINNKISIQSQMDKAGAILKGILNEIFGQ